MFPPGNAKLTYSTHLGVMYHSFFRCVAAPLSFAVHERETNPQQPGRWECAKRSGFIGRFASGGVKLENSFSFSKLCTAAPFPPLSRPSATPIPH